MAAISLPLQAVRAIHVRDEYECGRSLNYTNNIYYHSICCKCIVCGGHAI